MKCRLDTTGERTRRRAGRNWKKRIKDRSYQGLERLVLARAEDVADGGLRLQDAPHAEQLAVPPS